MKIILGQYEVELTEDIIRKVQMNLLAHGENLPIYDGSIVPHTAKDYLDAFCSYMAKNC